MADLGYTPTAGLPAGTSALAQTADLPSTDGLAGNSHGPKPQPNLHTAVPGVLQRSASTVSTKVEGTPSPVQATAPSRSGTLKKKASFRRQNSLKRSSSRKSLRMGSVRGAHDSESDFYSVFSTPVPTTGNPTEVLANRFQVWRKLLKDLINYFREIQSSYESRSKSLIKIANVINNTSAPTILTSNGGLDDAARILRGFHKQALAEANKAKDIEEDVITQLNGLRSDLSQKIKEIKSLAGDFKNSVDKEKETTRRIVGSLHDALATAESDPSGLSGKGDPFVVRLAVDRQVEKQIDEENYLHRAYLNLEGSGRELESIVVGEIQKAYNAYAGILKREADHAHETVDGLRSGPIAMQKDHEWSAFVTHDPHFVDPAITPRRLQDIHYPGKFSPLASEIRAGMLERKSKYLKSYTAGWYVLSPTHLHEFKSADHIHLQNPVMSLCLQDQKLGSRSAPNASSHKFSLKGRQAGSMHRGHSWVFRAESYDTMLAWYDDIMNLTEKTGAEKNAFVRKHARSTSGGTNRPPSVSSDGMDEDEADIVPFSGGTTSMAAEPVPEPAKRPEPGGRFPSDLAINRSRAPKSPSSGSSDNENDAVALAGSLPPSAVPISETPHHDSFIASEHDAQSAASHTEPLDAPGDRDDPTHVAAAAEQPLMSNEGSANAISHPPQETNQVLKHEVVQPSQSDPHIDEIAAAGGVGVLGVVGAAGAAAHKSHDEEEEPASANQDETDAEKLAEAHADVPTLPRDAERTESSFGAATASTAATSVDQSQADSANAGEDSYFKSGDGDDQSELTDDTEYGKPSDAPQAALHRQYTDVSASELHVPGEFPPTPAL